MRDKLLATTIFWIFLTFFSINAATVKTTSKHESRILTPEFNVVGFSEIESDILVLPKSNNLARNLRFARWNEEESSDEDFDGDDIRLNIQGNFIENFDQIILSGLEGKYSFIYGSSYVQVKNDEDFDNSKWKKSSERREKNKYFRYQEGHVSQYVENLERQPIAYSRSENLQSYNSNEMTRNSYSRNSYQNPKGEVKVQRSYFDQQSISDPNRTIVLGCVKCNEEETKSKKFKSKDKYKGWNGRRLPAINHHSNGKNNHKGKKHLHGKEKGAHENSKKQK